MNPVAIVGGGIAGLTAAFHLRKRGVPFTLYEAGGRCGGVIQTVRRDGFVAETGPNTIMETSPSITEFVRELGLESRKIYSVDSAANRYIVRDGTPVLLPGSPLAFAFTRLFSTSAKFRLMLEPFIPRAKTEEDLAAFVRRRLGEEFLTYAINPFVAGIFAGDPGRLSVRHAFPKLHALEQKYGSLILGQILGAPERRRSGTVSKQNAKKFSFDDGLSVLTEALEKTLAAQIRLHTKVVALENGDGGWSLTAEGPEGPVTARHCAILLVSPAHQIARIELRGCANASLRPLGEIAYSPVATVAVGYRREDVSHPLDGFGVLIPEVERMNILGTIFASSLFPNRAPKGCVLLTSYVGGARSPRLVDEPAETLLRLTRADLGKMIGATGRPVFENVTYYRNAIPQYEMRFGSFLDAMNQIESSAPGLFLAGHYRDGTSLGDSMVAGENAADRIARSLAGGVLKPVPHTPVAR
jgi:oxygen-dependent protoporphyrinogen oxidase